MVKMPKFLSAGNGEEPKRSKPSEKPRKTPKEPKRSKSGKNLELAVDDGTQRVSPPGKGSRKTESRKEQLKKTRSKGETARDTGTRSARRRRQGYRWNPTKDGE
jgi:hypothetical protein